MHVHVNGFFFLVFWLIFHGFQLKRSEIQHQVHKTC